MDPKQIRSLLEKYYNGETTLAEEEILLNYFKSETIDNEFIADKDIFLFNQEEKDKVDSLPDLTEDFWAGIQESDKQQTIKKNKRSLAYNVIRIAAGVIILIGSYFLIDNQYNSQDGNLVYVDTFEDPEEAYQEAKKTLLYVSQLLNNGTNHLEPIAKIEEGANKLNTIKSFNEGLKELDPIRKYSVADKYIKQ